MNSRHTQHAAALALSLILTLAIFSGVSALASPEQAGSMLVQATGSADRG